MVLLTRNSVLVHSGDLNAGHYYSFLRPEKDSPFFKFDDDRVTRATTREAIDENFGGEYPSTRKMAPMKRAMNAYMLVYYRKSRIDEILVPVAENDPPPHLRMPIYTPPRWSLRFLTRLFWTEKMFDEERAIREQRRREREEAHHYVTIKVATEGKIKAHKGFDLINYESQGQDSSPLVVRFRKDNIVRDLRAEVAKELNVDPNHVRLWVMVNRQNKTVRPDVPLQDLDKSTSITIFFLCILTRSQKYRTRCLGKAIKPISDYGQKSSLNWMRSISTKKTHRGLSYF